MESSVGGYSDVHVPGGIADTLVSYGVGQGDVVTVVAMLQEAKGNKWCATKLLHWDRNWDRSDPSNCDPVQPEARRCASCRERKGRDEFSLREWDQGQEGASTCGKCARAAKQSKTPDRRSPLAPLPPPHHNTKTSPCTSPSASSVPQLLPSPGTLLSTDAHPPTEALSPIQKRGREEDDSLEPVSLLSSETDKCPPETSLQPPLAMAPVRPRLLCW